MTEDYDLEEEGEGEIRECSNSCAHFDSINQCYWIVSSHGLCRNRREGDLCLYGFRENELE